MKNYYLFVFCFILLIITACSFPFLYREVTPIQQPTSTDFELTSTDIEKPTITLTGTVTFTHTPTETFTPTLTQTPTVTETPTLTPTYAILRGKVIPDSLNCRYGPGAMYLYKYGLYAGSNLEIIGRIDSGTWILVEAIGGSNACWVNANQMEIKGDVMTVAPVDPHIVMAWSPYYGALTGVSATRAGNDVTVFWNALNLRAGDDSEQIPYVLEAWVCIDGQIVFTPVGSYSLAAKVSDEAGCSEPSHGRVFAAEKHGYTPWMTVPWPSHDVLPSATP